MMRLTPAVKNLLILNVGIFLLQILFEGPIELGDGTTINYSYLTLYGQMYEFGDPNFKIWQLFTHMFLHGGFRHLLYNMISLIVFGPILEMTLGDKKFLLIYIISGFGSVGLHILASHYGYGGYPMLGASGAITGVMIATALLYPNMEVYLYFFIPLKLKYLAIFFVVFDIYSGVNTVDSIAHFAHVGGALFGYLLILYWRQKGEVRRF